MVWAGVLFLGESAPKNAAVGQSRMLNQAACSERNCSDSAGGTLPGWMYPMSSIVIMMDHGINGSKVVCKKFLRHDLKVHKYINIDGIVNIEVIIV